MPNLNPRAKWRPPWDDDYWVWEGLYETYQGEFVLWDGKDNGALIVVPTQWERPVLKSSTGHWTRVMVRDFLNEKIVKKTSRSVKLPPRSFCANCDIPLMVIDYLCEECR